MIKLPPLVEEHMALAQVIAFDYSNIPGITMDEAIAEAQGALLRAEEGFDPKKGEFSPYAARSIRNALNSLFAKQLKIARLFPRSLDEPPLQRDHGVIDSASGLGVEFPDSNQDVVKSVKYRETISILSEILSKSLSPREQIVVQHLRLGKSLAEIGESLGVSKQMVHKISSPALSKLKLALEQNGYRGIDSQGFLRSSSSPRIKPAG